MVSIEKSEMDRKLKNRRHRVPNHAMYHFNDPGMPNGSNIGSNILTSHRV